MANRIQIRHGSGAPQNSISYELGWDTTNSILYINNGTSDVEIGSGRFLPLTGGTLSGNLTVSKTGQANVSVINTTYGVQAYLNVASSSGAHGIWSNGYNSGSDASSFQADGKWIVYRSSNGDIILNGNAATASTLKDRTNNTLTYSNYGAAGLTASDFTWLTCWNGYELRAVSKAEAANAVDSAHKWARVDGDTITGTLTLSKTQDASGTVANAVALIVGGAQTAQHIEIDGNEILSKSDGTTPGTLYLQDSTGIVSVSGSGGLVVTATTSSTSTTTGALRVKGGIGCAGVINALATSCSWLSGQSGTYAPYNVGNATDSSGYWPWLRQTNTSSKKWFSFGTLGNSFYMIGSATTRTENGYDHGLYFDVSNGKLVVENCAVIRDSGATARKIFLTTSATKPSAAVAGDIVLVKV